MFERNIPVVLQLFNRNVAVARAPLGVAPSGAERTDPAAAVRVALALVLAGAAALRAAAIGLGQSSISFQADERFNNLDIPLHLSFADPNPHHFYYPALFWYALALADHLVFGTARRLGIEPTADLPELFRLRPLPFFWLARAINAALGVGTAALLFVLGRRLYSARHGLVAAALLAVAFLHVRDSALATVDVPMAFFVVVSLVGAAGVLRSGSAGDYLAAGLGAGLAASCKYNGAIVLLPVFTAHALAAAEHRRPVLRSFFDARPWGAALAAAVVFFAVNPFLLLDWRSALDDLLSEWAHQRRPHYVAVGSVWRYHLAFSLRYGVGVAALALGAAGIGRGVARREPGALLLASFALPCFAILASSRVAFARYMDPLVPVLCLFAALGAVAFAETGSIRGARRWAIPLITLVAGAEPLRASIAYASLVHRTDTRVETYRYFERFLPAARPIGTYGPPVVWKSTIPGFGDHLIHISPAPGETPKDVLARCRSYGVRYFLVHESPLDVFSPDASDLERALRQSGTLLAEFPFHRPNVAASPVYERPDGFYFPLGGFPGVRRPGPTVRIYRLD